VNKLLARSNYYLELHPLQLISMVAQGKTPKLKEEINKDAHLPHIIFYIRDVLTHITKEVVAQGRLKGIVLGANNNKIFCNM
jgi:hypothetical protein